MALTMTISVSADQFAGQFAGGRGVEHDATTVSPHRPRCGNVGGFRHLVLQQQHRRLRNHFDRGVLLAQGEIAA